jgi:hypothetical protein
MGLKPSHIRECRRKLPGTNDELSSNHEPDRHNASNGGSHRGTTKSSPERVLRRQGLRSIHRPDTYRRRLVRPRQGYYREIIDG